MWLLRQWWPATHGKRANERFLRRPYDEPKLLQGVRRRLGMPEGTTIPSMTVQRDVPVEGGGGLTQPYVFALPAAIAEMGAVYGEEMGGGGGGDANTAQHVAAIKTAVESLASMEATAQSLYVSLKKRKWAAAS